MSRTDGQLLTGAQALVESLERAGVEVAFGIPGGAILPAYDPLFDSRIRHILVRHEQGGGHAAEGYAIASGRVGVCIATSGPGATNLVTAIGNAYMDSTPLVAITGQVNGTAIGTDAFQEADIRGIVMPITKHSFLIKETKEIPLAIKEAFHIAATGRPGPVLVDIAKDALVGKAPFHWPEELDLPGYKPTVKPHVRQIRAAAKLISQSRRPVLHIGGGIVKAEAFEELAALVEKARIPVVTTLMARGALPDSHPLHMGMPGMHGTVAAVGALQRADLLIAIGEDPEREGLIGTPDRMARAWREMCSGLFEDPREHLRTQFHAGTDELVLVRDITFHSVCEHHLLPFYGRAHVGYIPRGGVVTGLSKLARLVEGYARRPQVQERLTAQIADALNEVLRPQGVIVVIEAEHMCMSVRGVRKPGSSTVTSALRGIMNDGTTRAEMMALVLGGRR